MLNIFGKKYFIEHCLNHLKQASRNDLLNVYVTDALKVIANNTSGTKEKAIVKLRFAELMNDSLKPAESKKEEDPEEIIKRIKQKLKKKGNAS